uniref:Uncharacterized protein n=1 Tax=Octopus bimaculoides TaxID=37653 RepID=A0A0L8GSC9_OCTBM
MSGSFASVSYLDSSILYLRSKMEFFFCVFWTLDNTIEEFKPCYSL